MLAPLPSIAPNQYVPLIARSTQPRWADGMSSSIVELIAEYSPPIASPVAKRQMVKLQTSHENAVASVAAT